MVVGISSIVDTSNSSVLAHFGRESCGKEIMANKLFVVETIEIFRRRYLIEAANVDVAQTFVHTHPDMEEWQQKHLGEMVMSVSPITRKDAEEQHKSDDGCPWMPLDKVIQKA